jgi:C1A family cysteine protease
MLDVEDLRSALLARGASWSAGPTRLSKLPGRHWALAGALDVSIEDSLQQASARVDTPHVSTEMPAARVDWRNNNGNWVSPVRDQDVCRSCVAFAACAVMESSLRIMEAAPDLEVALAPGPLFFSEHPAGCAEGRLASDIMAAAKSGVGLEADAPYSIDDPNYKNITPFLKVTGIRQMGGDARARKFFVADEGPIYAEMRIFEDFFAYEQGVYRHFQGDNQGLHAVVIIGYDDDQSCWIGMNSWGRDSQENGFFRIGYGECEIDVRPFIKLDVERVRDPPA